MFYYIIASSLFLISIIIINILATSLKPLLFSRYPIPFLIILIVITLTFAYIYQRKGVGAGRNITRKLHPDESRKKYLLTFDDGPSIEWTPRIIEILSENNLKAIFFVVGKEAEEHPDIIRKMDEMGMEIGVHSYSHKPLPFLFTGGIRQEIENTADAIREITGKSPRYFRPPWGLYNKEVLDIAGGNGMKTILWSRSSIDWKESDPGKIRNNVIEKMLAEEILLFHDGCKKGASRGPTVKALPVIIEELGALGFSPAGLEYIQ
ncbi:MAG: polysaccharide deacetylase family protein [Candidatus Eremiobacteraeota bacterium]|nr:polysaccharide deacetylase family protein [Candidatus Eremiobacteraeota bacterium]